MKEAWGMNSYYLGGYWYKLIIKEIATHAIYSSNFFSFCQFLLFPSISSYFSRNTSEDVSFVFKTLPIAVVLFSITVYEVCIMRSFQAKLPKLAILCTLYTCQRLLSGACAPWHDAVEFWKLLS